MNFEWDEDKNRANIRKHGFDFNDAWEIFDNFLLDEPDTRQYYGEQRWSGIGLLGNRIVVLIYTQRGNSIRIICLRKAAKHERKKFEKEFQNRLGPYRSNDG